MNKGLGQKIVIKFTDALKGDVSGACYGIGWERKEFTKAENTTKRTNGWKFSVKENILVTGLMIFSDANELVTMHLWKVSDKSMLTKQSFYSGVNEWTTYDLTLPIRLTVGEEYIVTTNNPINGGYMCSDTLEEQNRQDFSSDITIIDAYRVDSQDTFPTVRLTGPYTCSVGFKYQKSGNERSFTVTGNEYQYINGPLLAKEYKVDKVERYPTPKLWECDFVTGTLENTKRGDLGLQLEEGE